MYLDMRQREGDLVFPVLDEMRWADDEDTIDLARGDGTLKGRLQ